MSQRHTLLLLQASDRVESRTYEEFDSKEACLTYLCEMFEARLRAKQPAVERLQYGADELLGFIGALPDVVCLVESDKTSAKAYVPHGKDWVQEQVIKMLRAQAAKGT